MISESYSEVGSQNSSSSTGKSDKSIYFQVHSRCSTSSVYFNISFKDQSFHLKGCNHLPNLDVWRLRYIRLEEGTVKTATELTLSVREGRRTDATSLASPTQPTSSALGPTFSLSSFMLFSIFLSLPASTFRGSEKGIIKLARRHELDQSDTCYNGIA